MELYEFVENGGDLESLGWIEKSKLTCLIDEVSDVSQGNHCVLVILKNFLLILL